MTMVSTPSRMARALLWVSRLLLAAGVLALGYAAYVVADTKAYQAIEERRFERSTKAAVVFSPLVEGGTIGRMQIPRIGLAALVAQGDTPAILSRAIGHVADTALPGEPGNVVLAGHRDTFFRPLRGVRIGDAITLTTQGGAFEYLVESTAVVAPDHIQVLEPTNRRTLTLVTCFPFTYLGPAPKRFVVRAREVTSR